MAAPGGNRFWELRSKHGRGKLFSNSKLLWAAACEYFTWCEENPLMEVQFHGKDAIRCEVPKMRAFTKEGLCIYLGCSTSYFRSFKSRYDNSTKQEEKDFLTVITRIEEVIYNQKFTGAAAGFLKENIIIRDLGLHDTQKIDESKIVKYKLLDGSEEDEVGEEDEGDF